MRTDLVARRQLHRLGLQLGRKIDEIVERDALPIERRRLGDEGLGRRIPLAGNVALLDRALFDGPHRLARDAIEGIDPSLLGRLRKRLDGAAVDRDVDQDRCTGNVHIPDAVVHQLVVPLALAGRQIHGHDALTEQAGARTMAAVVVAGGQLDRQIRHIEFFVDRNLSPDAGVARVDPRLLFPRVVPELAQLRNRVEDPQPLAGLDVEAADVALLVLLALGRTSRHVRGADDDGVLRDDGRRVEADFAGHRVHHLIVVLLQIDDAVGAEIPHQLARHRVQGHELVARRHVEHAAIVLAVGPVGEAAARELARRGFAPGPFVLLVHPQHLAGRGVEPDDRAARAGGDVDHAVGHQRRGFPVVFGSRAERVSLEAPGHLELAEVVLVDLIEGRIVRVREVGGVGAPFPVGRGGLSDELDRRAGQDDGGDGCGGEHGAFHVRHGLSPSLVRAV